VRAGELGQSVLAYYGAPAMLVVPTGFAPEPAAVIWNAALPRLVVRLKKLWLQAPLLILLLAWLLLGIAGGVFNLLGVENWTLGFLALVGFQFYATVRRPRF
jgi:hypothetical protein